MHYSNLCRVSRFLVTLFATLSRLLSQDWKNVSSGQVRVLFYLFQESERVRVHLVVIFARVLAHLSPVPAVEPNSFTELFFLLSSPWDDRPFPFFFIFPLLLDRV